MLMMHLCKTHQVRTDLNRTLNTQVFPVSVQHAVQTGLSEDPREQDSVFTWNMLSASLDTESLTSKHRNKTNYFMF